MDVTADDLTKPLGLEERPKRFASWRFPFAPVLAGAMGALFGCLAIYIAMVDDPLGGEPYVIVPIQAAIPTPSGLVQSAGPPASQKSEPARSSAQEVESASGVSIVRAGGAAAPGAVVIRIPESGLVKLAPAPDARLVERTRHGILPKIAADGARPLEVYARPPGELPAGARPVARIALVVTGLGISQTATAGAIAKLPPAVTLAFAPYGNDLERQVAQAREEGHEVMLQVPMEPFDYPDNDPGPQTLTARAKPAENLAKLHWAMGRFPGYIGLVNFMGAKLTSDETALSPILREIGGRGLGFLDDGSSSRSLVSSLGPATGTPAARADVVIDGTPRSEAIDAELARLEELAKKRGFALGTATALPLTVDRILRWTRILEARNILIVPVSAAFAERR